MAIKLPIGIYRYTYTVLLAKTVLTPTSALAQPFANDQDNDFGIMFKDVDVGVDDAESNALSGEKRGDILTPGRPIPGAEPKQKQKQDDGKIAERPSERNDEMIPEKNLKNDPAEEGFHLGSGLDIDSA